jgi:hypothetical protein
VRGKPGELAYPNIEVEVLVRDRLDVEAYCGYRGDDLADLRWAFGQYEPLLHVLDQMPHTFNLYKSVVLPALSCSHWSAPERRRLLQTWSAYKAQDEDANFLLRPDQSRELGQIAAHGVAGDDSGTSADIRMLR